MKNKIDSSEHGFWERFFINIPFILIVAFIVAFFGGGALLFFYSFVTLAAFKSAMIFLIVFGGSIFGIGLGLVFILIFKKYHVFYEKRMGIFQACEIQTTTTNTKTFKDYFTLSNISYSILFVGGILCIISAVLGCTNRSNWVDAISPYLNDNGYYADVEYYDVQYYVENVSTHTCDVKEINIDFDYKQAVIIYTEEDNDQGYIKINTYISYNNQVTSSIGKNNEVISLKDNPPPKIEKTALNKLMFFVFDDNYFENQVKIYIPLDYKDSITMNELGNSKLIIAKNKENNEL